MTNEEYENLKFGDKVVLEKDKTKRKTSFSNAWIEKIVSYQNKNGGYMIVSDLFPIDEKDFFIITLLSGEVATFYKEDLNLYKESSKTEGLLLMVIGRHYCGECDQSATYEYHYLPRGLAYYCNDCATELFTTEQRTQAIENSTPYKRRGRCTGGRMCYCAPFEEEPPKLWRDKSYWETKKNEE